MASVTAYGTATIGQGNIDPAVFSAHTFGAAVNGLMFLAFGYANTLSVVSAVWDAAGDNVAFTSQWAHDVVSNTWFISAWTLHEDDIPTALPLTKDITVDISGHGHWSGAIQNFDNVDPTTPMDHKSGLATGTSTLVTVDVTGHTADDHIVDTALSQQTKTVGAGQTQIFQVSQQGRLNAASREQAASPVTMSWTQTSGAWGTAAGALKAAAAAGGAVPGLKALQRDRTLGRVVRM